ncbi:MCM5 [Scenedesmus sp. PABB004]|nr:MCM5 [Scenedesmus sp. PABB004]
MQAQEQPAPTGARAAAARADWRLRSVRWGAVLNAQHWGGLLLLIPMVVLIAVAHFKWDGAPVVRQGLLYDASISLPPAPRVSVSDGLAVVFNWICMLVAVLVIELALFRRQHSLTLAIAATLHWLWSCAVSFVIVVAVTEITKPFSGRLRPDWLSRCQPADAVDPASNVTTAALGGHAAALGPQHIGQLAGPCTNPSEATLRDGRLSFPSGHAANSMAVAWFTAIYIAWSLYVRRDAPLPPSIFRPPPLPPRRARTLLGRVAREAAHALCYGFLLLALALSWFIGMTRFWDNRHHISDIVGGFLLAIIFSTPYAVKAVGLHVAMAEVIDGAGGAAGDAKRAPDRALLPVAAAPAGAPAGAGPGEVVVQMGPLPPQGGGSIGAPRRAAPTQPPRSLAALPKRAMQQQQLPLDARAPDWRLGAVRWRALLYYQNWAGWILIVPTIIAIVLAHWLFQDHPVERTGLLYDATISAPHAAKNSVPNEIATVFNWVCILLSLLIVELGLFRRQQSLTMALAAVLHHMWCCAVSFIIVIAVAEMTKPFSGRLRPDWLSRCQPADAVGAAALRFGAPMAPCTNRNKPVVIDGRLSFPSGHASNTMAVAWYNMVYLVWSVYLRPQRPYCAAVLASRTVLGRLGREAAGALCYALVVAALALSWFIGVSRFWDNRHHISDIVGGFLVAIIFSTPYAVKAIGLHVAMAERIDGAGGAAGDAKLVAARDPARGGGAAPGGAAAPCPPHSNARDAAHPPSRAAPAPRQSRAPAARPPPICAAPTPAAPGCSAVGRAGRPAPPRAAMAFDEGGVFYANVGDDNAPDVRPGAQAIADFKDFITKFYPANTQQTFIYREKLMKNHAVLEVDLVHVREFNQELGDHLERRPAEFLPLFERAAKEVLKEDHQLTSEGEEQEFDDVQVLLFSSQQFGPASMRHLASTRVSQLVQLSGIITSASKPKHKASYLTVQCKECRATQAVPCKPGLGGALLPRRCETRDPVTNAQCPLNSWVVLGERSRYVDQQTLKFQERPEDIPTGELPRTLLMVVDRHLVGRVTPGSRLVVTGIYCTHRSQAMDKGPSSLTLQLPYLRVVDLQEEGEAHADDTFTNAERQAFLDLCHDPELIPKIAASIAPKIRGHDDIKAAIACLLFGGARKIMPDGTARRGDINVLLLGDPSVGKSQFLKFVSKVAPICVYTSGKGSSAAGLTAAVVQDANSREFFLEGGAMVLADGGVVCIDEFDKMRPEDRVAIHEAMEQQTISIAKAGITTVLKSRTSVLAAANPPSGRYDDLSSASDNIDLQTTILSRFDLIFIVRDVPDEAKDQDIARHVLAVHAGASRPQGVARAGGVAAAGPGAGAGPGDVLGEGEPPIDEKTLKRFIHYARSHCFPRLEEAAAKRLVAKYVELRDKARQAKAASDGEECPIPMTVRQLEALVRISESFARMGMAAEADDGHVAAAFDLFTKSTINAMNAGLINTHDRALEVSATQDVEARICERLHIGGHVSYRRLLEDMAGLGYSQNQVGLAVKVMLSRSQLRRKAEGKMLERARRRPRRRGSGGVAGLPACMRRLAAAAAAPRRLHPRSAPSPAAARHAAAAAAPARAAGAASARDDGDASHFLELLQAWLTAGNDAATVAELAATAPGNMSMLLNAVDRAGLSAPIADPAFTATVLCPTNKAFRAALLKLKITPVELWADKTRLVDILSGHLIHGTALAVADLKDGQELTTLNKHKLKVHVDKVAGTSFQGASETAQVIAADLKGGKSIIHIVDTVLLPPIKPSAA